MLMTMTMMMMMMMMIPFQQGVEAIRNQQHHQIGSLFDLTEVHIPYIRNNCIKN